MTCKHLFYISRRSLFSLFFVFAFESIGYGQNPIITENALPGTAQNIWDASDNNPIEGFAQEFSVNKGETVHFKIEVESATLLPYTVKIYRLGWYNGNGARFITNVGSGLQGKTQLPLSHYETATGKYDCSNWAVSTQWIVPTTAVSGVYVARLDCPGLSAKSLILFVVRDDAANTPLLFKTCDATWQAYNHFGGNDFYNTDSVVPGFNHATKLSYQRILHNRGDKTSFFNSEYPMIRWLERNGYNVSYSTDLDMARNSAAITPSIHKTIVSVGHDEYWSAEQRNKIETARNNGVNLAFFSGNEVYWKTRWEDNYQTLVCYKEGSMGENGCGYKCDPLPGVWTGLWRDGCQPGYTTDACYPEGSLSGQMSWAQSTGSIKVPDTYKNLRFWKNTSIALLGSGQTAVLPYGTLGNEWDPEQLTETYPAHRIVFSNTIQTGNIHKMSLYRHSSGALVFSAGTMQWAWGLDDHHDLNTATPPVLPPSQDMQQATVNLLSFMGLTAGSLQSGLVAPSFATDVVPPSTTINFPTHNSTVPGGLITISGTSADIGGGAVAGVEVSVDNGLTWNTATGLENWSYDFSPSGSGAVTIKVRAWDDLGNVEIPGSPGSPNCITIILSGPFNHSVFNSSYPLTPPTSFSGSPVELGMKFKSSIPGLITGFRYYKGPGVTGQHTGHLWSNTGTLLAAEVFTNESASGWQTVTLSNPVQISAETTYVVSYYTASGDFIREDPFFTSAVINGYLRGLANGEDGGNGVYAYSGTPTFPNNTSGSSNYYADIIFTSDDITPPNVVSVTPSNNSTGVSLNIHPTATLNEAIDPATVTNSTVTLIGPGNTNITGSVTLTNGNLITFTPSSSLNVGTLYTLKLRGGVTEPLIKDISGNALASDYIWSFTTGGLVVPVISTQPMSQTTCANSIISFSSIGDGIPTPTIKWQVSIDNGSNWSDIIGEVSDTLTFTALSTDNNNQYRAVWTNSQGADTSDAAILTVSATISGQIAAVNSNICLGSPMQLQLASATGPSPYSLVINSNVYTGITVGQSFRTVLVNESFWSNSTTPSEITVADNNSAELGIKFKATADGVIKGIRFYKGSIANGGIHTGSLWTVSGTLLASATFINESSSGWQEVLFATPVSVSANTTYVASYFSPLGNYSRTGPYFDSEFSNGNSLIALSNSESPNGVYSYNAQSAFPNSNFGSPNYWVDVIFAAYTSSTTIFNLTSITASNSCVLSGNPISTASITVNPTQNSGTITGLNPLCIGVNTSYVSDGDLGGAWSSSNEGVAIVNPITGEVTAVGAGSADIIYKITGCTGIDSSFKTLTVTPNSNAGTVNGTDTLCIGSTATFSVSGVVLSGGTGIWSSSDTLVAKVDSLAGLVTAINGGNCNIIYTVTGGCGGPVFSQRPLSINPDPSIVSVTGGTGTLCIGSTTTFTANGVVLNGASGAWSSSDTLIAKVDSLSGLITAVSAGNCNIIYSITGGCNGTVTAQQVLTVNPSPTLDQPINIGPLCNNAYSPAVNFTSTTSGPGTISYDWINDTPIIGLAASGSGNISSFVVNNSGTSANLVANIIVTPQYTYNTVSCLGDPKSFLITVLPASEATITGAANLNICAGTDASVDLTFAGTSDFSAIFNIATEVSPGVFDAGISYGPVIYNTSGVQSLSIPASQIPNSTSTAKKYRISWVSMTDGNGCTSTSLGGNIELSVEPLPVISVGAAPSVNLCPGTVISFDVDETNSVGGTFDWVAKDAENNILATGSNVTYGINAVSTDLAPVGLTCSVNNPVTFTFTPHGSGTQLCEGDALTREVTIKDDIAPIWVTALGSLDVSLECSDAAGIAAAQALFPVASDNCDNDVTNIIKVSGDLLPGTCPVSGTYTNTWTVTDDCGNTSTVFTQLITITDLTAPVLTPPATQTLNVGAGAGCTVLMPDYTGLVSVIDCNSTTLEQLAPNEPGSSVVGYAGGPRIVIIRATDACGNSSTTSFTLNLVDATAPNAVCKNITVDLDVTGNASITPAMVDNGSNDNCSSVTLVSVLPNSFDCSNVGPNAVTLTVMDSEGNTSTCQSTVTVRNLIPPVITCWGDTTIAKGPDCTNILDDLTFRVNRINSCGVTTVTQNIPAGTTISSSLPFIDLTLNVADANGNSSTCSFRVNFVDLTAPVISGCPSNVLVNTGSSNTQCSQTATWTSPTADDNCGIASFTSTHNSGDAFPVGETTVTYTAVDIHGNTETCTFTVTVVDDTKPVISNCPANINLTSSAGNSATCSQTATWTSPTADDNCGIASFTSTHNSGDAFPVGETTVTYTAVDIHGNTETCTFTVTVVDDTKPVISNCPANINLTSSTGNSATCSQTATWTSPTADDNCGIASFTSTHNSGDAFPVGETTVTYTAVDIHGNTETCTFTVTVVDDTKPVISNCPANINLTSSAGNSATCSQTATWTSPTADDNCGIASFTSTHNSGDAFPVGETTVTYTAVDIHGNTETCTFTVTVVDDTKPVISNCPANINLTSSAGNSATCSQTATWTSPTADDNCGIASFTSTHNSGDAFPVGETTVTYTAVDIHGNTETCTFTVTVVDDTKPVISNCPANINLTSSTGNSATCSQTATWTSPTADDNCGIASFTSTHNSGDAFPVGETTVTYTAVDIHGNTETCTFTVTVVDDTKPVISNCPANINLTSSAGNSATCSQTATWTSPTADDNCGIASFTSTHNSGDAFPVGETTVTYTAVDIHGNTETCTFTVTVVDDTKPDFVFCPSPVINAPTNGAGCIATIVTSNPIVSDNCSISSLTWALTGATTGASGGTGMNYLDTYNFNGGTTTVTYTATDASGNTRTCIFTVSVATNLSSTIGGTATVAQNGSITPNITFTGSGGVKPYTFTYNISENGGAPGSNQTISTTGTSSLVTVPQSNAVLGTYKYTLVSITDANGCGGTLPAPPADAATVNVVSGLPDITSSQFLSSSQIGVGGTIQEVIQVRNLGSSANTAPIVFTVTNYFAFTGISAASNNNPSVTLGFTTYPLSNATDWDVTVGATTLTFTSKPGVVINAGALKNVGITINRTGGAGGDVNHTVTISSGTGGGETPSTNNTINNNIFKN